MTDLRYPIGEFQPRASYSAAETAASIRAIEQFPENLRSSVAALDETQLKTPYRPGGWSVLQVVHHVADSHLNAYVRTKLALSLDSPTINAFPEAVWAELPDAIVTDLEPSLNLLTSVHLRWRIVLNSLTPQQLDRQYLHPESGPTPLSRMIALYDWHSRHHLAHIDNLKQREGW